MQGKVQACSTALEGSLRHEAPYQVLRSHTCAEMQAWKLPSQAGTLNQQACCQP